ncbi:DNA polymerase [Agrobacterium tumefaciens]|uniref:DNA polymerase n=1 Tax=Agrobacterium tumefaciens TaxID=358 RepID=UPI002243113C|nr:DNA polymerase [Agrobacterium tumefaciens]MCW8061229.1 DNA polymerase [Agrobacterium tumefaciens]MCW8147392.1 DNA polymerase [Agrobacterium tumefaciens]
MIDTEWAILLFVKDFTGRGGDKFYWLKETLVITTPEEIVAYAGTIVCHDFWIIRDVIYDEAGDLPRSIVDLDEFRITISGNPDDRIAREKMDISVELTKFGANSAVCSTYRKMFNRGVEFDATVAEPVARAMASMFVSLCDQAKADGEWERFDNVEVPVYRLLQKAMATGITIDSTDLSKKRREADFDYFFSLKEYSAKHDMPLETPSISDIEDRLSDSGFDLTGVSTEYVLEFLPHDGNFGEDTLSLRELDGTKKVLSSLPLFNGRTRPIIDVFGSRTSRIHLRSPALQNISKKYRSIIKAPKGTCLSYVDYDQYEVGIMAALSGDPQLKMLYNAGDMYALFATEHLKLVGNRKAAKQLFLSYAYGMSRRALVDAAVCLGAERANAKAAFSIFGVFEDWKKSVSERFLKDGSIATVLGNHYKRSKTGQLSAKEQRSAVSQIVQGTASLIFKRALLEIDHIADVKITLPMHDALLFEHHSADTPAKVVEIFEDVMTKELNGVVAGKASIGQFASE